MRRKVILLSLIAIFVTLVVLDHSYVWERMRYARWIVFERQPCGLEVDWDHDGTPEHVRIEKSGDANWLVIESANQPLLRVRYEHLDGTLRTHLARRGDRLLIYDGVTYRPPLSVVYQFVGRSFRKVEPDDYERQLLQAMAFVDDTGYSLAEAVYSVARPVIFIGLLAALFILVIRWL